MKERNRQFDKIVETKVSSGSIGNMRNYGSASQPLDRGCSEELKVKTATISENLIRQTRDLGEYAQNTLNRLIEKVEPISRCEVETDCVDNEKRAQTFPKLYEEWFNGNITIEHFLNEINGAIDRIEL
jgi:hypothetical protein